MHRMFHFRWKVLGQFCIINMGYVSERLHVIIVSWFEFSLWRSIVSLIGSIGCYFRLSNIRNFTESLFPITFFAIFGIFVLKRLTLCSNYKSAKRTKLKSDTFLWIFDLSAHVQSIRFSSFSLFQYFSNFCFYMFENFIDFLTFLDFLFLFIGGVFKHLFLSLLLLLIYLSFMLTLMMMFDIYTHTTPKLGLWLKGPWLLQAQKFQLGYCYVIWHCP